MKKLLAIFSCLALACSMFMSVTGCTDKGKTGMTKTVTLTPTITQTPTVTLTPTVTVTPKTPTP